MALYCVLGKYFNRKLQIIKKNYKMEVIYYEYVQER